MLTTLWAKFEVWIIGIFAVLAAIGGAILYGREKGKASEKQAAAVDQAQQQINTATAIVDRSEVRKDVEVETAKLPPDTTAPVAAQSGSAPAAPYVPRPDPTPGSSADVLHQQWSRD
jgi:hypothetical protein